MNSGSLSEAEVASLEVFFGYEDGVLADQAAVERGFGPLVDPELDIREWAKRRRGRRRRGRRRGRRLGS